MIDRILRRIKKTLRRFLQILQLFAYRVAGTPPHPFFCPLCELPVREWQRFVRRVGANEFREETEGRLCPHCNSFERTRHFALYMKTAGWLMDRPRFLHFAPERVLGAKLRRALGKRYISTDLFMRGVDAREDITAMKFADGAFDMIYCSNVLEHIEDDHAAMSELFRVLSTNGRAIIQVPIRGAETYEDPAIVSPEERARHFGQADHVRYYGRDIKKRLERAGFEVEERFMLDLLDLQPPDVERYNVGKREPIHFCRKTGRPAREAP